MAFALHRWNRDTLLARLAASEAIDAAALVDPVSAARQRLRLLGVGDQLEARALTDAAAITVFTGIRHEAERTCTAPAPAPAVGAVAVAVAD